MMNGTAAASTPSQSVQQQQAPAAPAADDPMARLSKLKQMLDAGLIEQAEYDAVKKEILSKMM